MDKYIELDRRFVEFDPKSIGERDQHTHTIASMFHGGKSWNDVLANRCTVIISEAGTGKTTELRNRARILRNAGKHAFFCRLDLLVDSPLGSCLEGDSKTDFEKWCEGDEPGYFFLDSVDEAKLANVRDFETALLRFVEAVQPNISRATIVISTRPNAWQVVADPAMLASRLGVTLPAEPKSEARPEEVEDEWDGVNAGDVASAENAATAMPSEPSALSILQMAPLDDAQKRIFATAQGAEDVNEFLAAIEQADADSFASRPADLQGLIEVWKEHRRIGRYREVVENNVKTKLREANPAHLDKTIDEKKALEGAQRLAAAVTLTQKSSIRLPDTPADPTLATQSIGATDILPEWTPSEIKSLLGRALFDESLSGTVRFHHRAAREYLTAQWLGGLLDKRKSRRNIQALLFGMPYGVLAEAIVPSMRPVAAWLALDDQNIRDKIMGVDPKVLLEFGDASSLDAGTRASLLKKFAGQYRNRQNTPLSLDIREVRRLADQSLGPLIVSMLNEYHNHLDIRQLLLRIVREGRVQDCGEAVLPFATSAEIDEYTRSYAIQAIGAAGTPQQKEEVKREILVAVDQCSRLVLAAAIETLPLSLKDVARICEDAPAGKRFASDHLESELEGYARRLNLNGKKELLAILVRLLSKPPVKDENYCRVSQRFAWLLATAFEIAKEVLALEPSPFDKSVLAALSMAEQSDHLSGYHGDINRDLRAVLEGSRTLKHALYWFEVEEKRDRSRSPVTEFWYSGADLCGEDDFPLFAEALQRLPSMDDKKVALSSLLNIYSRLGNSVDLLERIKALVAGNRELESWLSGLLAPRPVSADLAAEKRRNKAAEAENLANKKKREKYRREWIATLKADPSRVGDLAIAAEGKVWNNTYWLANEIRTKKKSSSRWTITDWTALEPEFGSKVAAAFRDFCIAFWRLYEPKLRSEIGSETSQTPLPVIVGLSGLAMEFLSNSKLAETLSDDEVKRAVGYALDEVNGFPPWLLPLYRARPNPVREVLVAEMRWELSTPKMEGSVGYVLSRLRWNAFDLSTALLPELLDLIISAPENDLYALTEALIVVLRDPSLPAPAILAHARAKAKKAKSDEEKALWLAVILCLDANYALPELEKWLKKSENAEVYEARITLVLNHVWGDRYDGFNSPHKDYARPKHLLRLLKLAHTGVQIEADLEHEDGYSPGARDHAQRARSHLLELLYNIPGRATYDALLALSEFFTLQYLKDRMLTLAEQRAGLDLEKSPWTAEQVQKYEAETERVPNNEKELFDLAVSRLDDIKLELEEGDESEASLLRKVADENELRRTLAIRLRNAAREKYTTGSEEELADKTRTDIRLHNPNVKVRTPIEIKIAGKWTAGKLSERLKNQLTAQYLLEARRGIFLLVNRGGKKDTKTWKFGSKRVGFQELAKRLGERARSLVASKPGLDEIEVIGIDLTLRDRKKVTTSKARSRPKSAAAKVKKHTASSRNKRVAKKKPKAKGKS